MKKTMVAFVIFFLAGLLFPSEVSGNCPAYEDCRREADRKRRERQADCFWDSLLYGAPACIGLGVVNVGGGAACTGVLALAGSVCDDKAEHAYDQAVGECHAFYVLGPGCQGI